MTKEKKIAHIKAAARDKYRPETPKAARLRAALKQKEKLRDVQQERKETIFCE